MRMILVAAALLVAGCGTIEVESIGPNEYESRFVDATPDATIANVFEQVSFMKVCPDGYEKTYEAIVPQEGGRFTYVWRARCLSPQ